jgi:hypothetical protein
MKTSPTKKEVWSIAQWRAGNETLSQKNAYFNKEIPKLKGKLDKLTLLLQEQEEKHTKEMRASNHELLKATEMYDQLQADFNIVSGLKMGELLDGIMIDRI